MTRSNKKQPTDKKPVANNFGQEIPGKKLSQAEQAGLRSGQTVDL